MATPPESPHAALMRDTSLQYEDAIIPELDIYAIPSKEGMCRFFSLHESYVYCILSPRSSHIEIVISEAKNNAENSYVPLFKKIKIFL